MRTAISQAAYAALSYYLIFYISYFTIILALPRLLTLDKA